MFLSRKTRVDNIKLIATWSKWNNELLERSIGFKIICNNAISKNTLNLDHES